MKRVRQGQVPMYQVFVTDTDKGHEIPVGPRMDVQNALVGLVERINVAVSRGQLTGWKNAYIKRLEPNDGKRLVV